MYKQFLLDNYKEYPIPSALSEIDFEFSSCLVEKVADPPVLESRIEQSKKSYSKNSNSIGDSILYSVERSEISFDQSKNVGSIKSCSRFNNVKGQVRAIKGLCRALGLEEEVRLLFIVVDGRLEGPYTGKEVEDKFERGLLSILSQLRLIDVFTRDSGEYFTLQQAIHPNFVEEISISPFLEGFVKREQAEFSVIENQNETVCLDELDTFSKLSQLKPKQVESFTISTENTSNTLEKPPKQPDNDLDEWEDIRIGKKTKPKRPKDPVRNIFAHDKPKPVEVKKVKKPKKKEEDFVDFIIRKKEEKKEQERQEELAKRIKPMVKRPVVQDDDEGFVEVKPKKRK